jgi:hypothetical protein
MFRLYVITVNTFTTTHRYEGDSVNRSQMNIKRQICDIRTWKKNIYLSTYPPQTLIHLPHRFTSASKPTA